MEFECRLGECAEEFITRLTDGAGFTREEATDFVESAVPALMESYAWQAHALEAAGLDSMSGVRWLLAGVRAKALAARAGLSPQRTWDGLRAMAPAMMRVVDAEPVSGDSIRLDVGFGLAVDGASGVDGPEHVAGQGNVDTRGPRLGARRAGIVHPIFGSLLRMRDLHHS